MHNRVIHVKLFSDEPEKLGSFYQDVFDWRIEKMPRPPDAWRMDSGDGFGVNCSLFRRNEPLPAGIMALTISVSDIDRYVERFVDAGGRIMQERKVAFGNSYVYGEDPDGNVVCIVEFGNESN